MDKMKLGTVLWIIGLAILVVLLVMSIMGIALDHTVRMVVFGVAIILAIAGAFIRRSAKNG